MAGVKGRLWNDSSENEWQLAQKQCVCAVLGTEPCINKAQRTPSQPLRPITGTTTAIKQRPWAGLTSIFLMLLLLLPPQAPYFLLLLACNFVYNLFARYLSCKLSHYFAACLNLFLLLSFFFLTLSLSPSWERNGRHFALQILD